MREPGRWTGRAKREKDRTRKRAGENVCGLTELDCRRMTARSTGIALAHTYAYAREGWKAEGAREMEACTGRAEREKRKIGQESAQYVGLRAPAVRR